MRFMAALLRFGSPVGVDLDQAFLECAALRRDAGVMGRCSRYGCGVLISILLKSLGSVSDRRMQQAYSNGEHSGSGRAASDPWPSCGSCSISAGMGLVLMLSDQTRARAAMSEGDEVRRAAACGIGRAKGWAGAGLLRSFGFPQRRYACERTTMDLPASAGCSRDDAR